MHRERRAEPIVEHRLEQQEHAPRVLEGRGELNDCGVAHGGEEVALAYDGPDAVRREELPLPQRLQGVRRPAPIRDERDAPAHRRRLNRRLLAQAGMPGTREGARPNWPAPRLVTRESTEPSTSLATSERNEPSTSLARLLESDARSQHERRLGPVSWAWPVPIWTKEERLRRVEHDPISEDLWERLQHDPVSEDLRERLESLPKSESSEVFRSSADARSDTPPTIGYSGGASARDLVDELCTIVLAVERPLGEAVGGRRTALNQGRAETKQLINYGDIGMILRTKEGLPGKQGRPRRLSMFSCERCRERRGERSRERGDIVIPIYSCNNPAPGDFLPAATVIFTSLAF